MADRAPHNGPYSNHVYGRDLIIRLARESATGDLVERVTALGADPILDEASMRIGESLSADLIQENAEAIRQLVEAMVARSEEGDADIDFTPAQRRLAEAAAKACSAAFLRGVLLGHAMRQEVTDGR